MADFWDAYLNDSEKETQGVWHEFRGGLALKIARADVNSNPIYAAEYQRLMLEVDTEDDQAVKQVMPELYSVLITDAKGLVNINREPVEFSREFVTNVFKRLPEILNQVALFAVNFDNYKEEREQAIKALGKL